MTDSNQRVEKIEGWVIKIVGLLIGLIISATTYLIQDKMTEMSQSMKSIERTVNNMQIQQTVFQKDVEYLRIEQQNFKVEQQSLRAEQQRLLEQVQRLENSR